MTNNNTITNQPTQVAYKFNAAKRTAFQFFVSYIFLLIPALIFAGEELVKFVETVFPGSPAAGVIAGTVAALTALGAFLSAVMGNEKVNAFLTHIGFGATPKNVETVVSVYQEENTDEVTPGNTVVLGDNGEPETVVDSDKLHEILEKVEEVVSDAAPENEKPHTGI